MLVGRGIIRCYDFLFGLLGKILLFIGMFFIVCRKGLFLFIGIFLSVCRNALFFLSEEYFSVYEKYSVPFHPGIKKASGMIVRRLCFIL